MDVSRHVAYTTPLAFGIGLADPVAGCLFWAGGVLIDTDHYFDHIAINRNWSLRRAYRWHLAYAKWLVGRPCQRTLLVFHTIESLALIAMSALVFPFLWPLFQGMLFHLFLDKVQDFRTGLPWVRAVSVFQWLRWARDREFLAPTEEDLAVKDARARVGTFTGGPADLIHSGKD